ncbi:MAG: hypothetical protein QNJ16_09860 [Rhodobacter sp.]|nr:hypothetical protein [Rhodobacter sp.]
MDLISDILLIAGAVGAAFYCIVLSRRLSRFTDLDKGVGGAIAVLSAQVDDMTKALDAAQGTANGSTDSLEMLTDRAEDVARRLELLVASMHDLPDATASASAAPDPQRSGGPAGVAGQEAVFARRRDDGGNADASELFRSHRTWAQEAAE